MLKLRKYPPRGFTLIELLVVILIIGILAAIALPHYKMAVAKTKYNSIKIKTRALADAAGRYYLINDSYANSVGKLDVELPEAEMYTNENKRCEIWYNGWNYAACFTEIFGTKMGYYVNFLKDDKDFCLADSKNTDDIYNKICQDETQKNKNQAICPGNNSYCMYYY